MCYHPWVGLDISPQGEFKPCCKYKHTISNSLSEYQNSQVLADLKSAFLKNERPDGCSRCWQDEDAGLPSKRMLDNEYVFQNQAPSLDSLKVLSIPFGNICNLACRICSSHSSSKWSVEAKKIESQFPDIKIFGHNQFYKDTDFMSAIKGLSKEVIRVEIPGGEPFFADLSVHLDFLKHLTEHNPSDISLHYTTNGTVFPDQQILETWKHFKKVDVQISIDGVRSQFEYNRWPAIWSNVLLNIGRYVNHCTTNNNTQLSISHSVSVFTIYHLPEFLTWCKDNQLPAPYLGLVSKPSHYSITILPDGAKEAITKKFKNIPELEPILKAMWAQDNTKDLDNFIKHVKILDTQRKQNFADVFPELYQLLGEKCQTLYQLY